MGKRKKEHKKSEPVSWQSMVSEREHAIASLEKDIGCFERPSDKEFCGSLVHQFQTRGFLTDRQWYWVKHKSRAAKRIQNPREPRKRLHHVYAIGAGEQIKIGRSTNPKARLRALQTSNPIKLKLLCVIPVENSGKAASLEKKLHKECREYHVIGEWFKLDALSVVKKFSKERLGQV